MGGYSIYASSLDGSDKCVRLEAYMADEHGGKDGWKIEKCYVKDDSNREMLDIIAGKFFIAYAPIESEKFLSMPKELARKYEEKFKYPERFYKSMDGIEAKPYKPVSKDMVADVYSHIIDEDRRYNAQKFEEQFYNAKGLKNAEEGKTAPMPKFETSVELLDPMAEVQKESEVEKEKPAENSTDENAALLTKLLSNPETAALLKALAKTI